MTAALTVARLSARRGGREILRDVSFTAHEGEILAVIGPNGAGKTTLFECVAGLLPHSGDVQAAGRIHYVPDGIRPWPDQTVRWTLNLGARMFDATVDESLLDALALRPLLDQRVHTLSKGEAKRLGIALGLGVPDALILLDEPFDGLDLRQTRQAIDALRRTQRTLVLSIHQLRDAARIGDRFLLLDNGRAVAHGTLPELGGDLEEAFLALT